MTRLFVCLGVWGAWGCMAFTNVWAVPTPVFYAPLESEAEIVANFNGDLIRTNVDFVPSPIPGHGNVFQSTSNATNNGGWAKWDDNAINTIFSNWDNNSGITIDHYFLSNSGALADLNPSPAVNEGMWAIVRRNNLAGEMGDSYLFTSLQNGRLRIAFANSQNEQYKFTFNGNPANPGAQEYANGVNIPLTDGVPYRLTVSIGDGVFKVFLDDVNGEQYSNDLPLYVNDTIIPDGYNWQLPPSGDVHNSGNLPGRQTREMDIGIRGFGHTNNSINNFGGTLRSGNWVDEVKIYNGVYTPADLVAGPSTDGDFNGDGIVDAADYVMWRKGLDPSGGTSSGYADFFQNFGTTTSGNGGGNQAVPEPGTLLLLVAAVLLAAVGRRCR